MGAIYTSYFGNAKNFPENSFTISVARTTPIKVDAEFRELFPSDFLLHLYKTGQISSGDYKKYYLVDLWRRGVTQEVIKNVLTKLVDINENVFILCYERPEDFCHRHIIADLVPELGIKEYPVYKKKEEENQ